MASAGEHQAAAGAQAVRARRLVDATELAVALNLREEVFCGEQGVSLAAERDGRDAGAVHLGAFEDGELVGTCRLLEDSGGGVSLQRLAVRRERRGSGAGRVLLDAAIAEARLLGAGAVQLHAQLASEGFYLRQGFTRRGEPFAEEGIEHVAMRRELEAVS